MDPPATPLLEFSSARVERLARRAARGSLLGDLSLSLAPGEICAVAGESGAGKSTLAQLALGALPSGLRLAGGSVRWRGKELMKLKPRERARLRAREIVHIGTRAEAPFSPEGSVAQALGGLRRLCMLDEGDERLEECLHAVGLVEIEREFGSALASLPTLSVKRLCLLRALLCEAPLVVLDDISTDLSPAAAALFLETVRQLRDERGLAVLLTTGRPRPLAVRADRLVILFEGRILEQGPPAELLQAPRFRYTREFLDALPGTDPRPRELPTASPEAVEEARAALGR